MPQKKESRSIAYLRSLGVEPVSSESGKVGAFVWDGGFTERFPRYARPANLKPGQRDLYSDPPKAMKGLRRLTKSTGMKKRGFYGP